MHNSTHYHFIQEFNFECGESLREVQIAYRTFGNLNATRSNAILVCHALTGDANLTCVESKDEPRSGWWNKFVGSGLAIDTDKYFVICSNVLGGCAGSTGPSSIDNSTGKPYGLRFPFVTLRDMVRAQHDLLTKGLELKGLHACIGGSMGAMQALEWSVSFPTFCDNLVLLAGSAYQSPQNIALHEVGRRAIMNDPHWLGGNYYNHAPPHGGLSIARMIAHITYLSDQTMHNKFGRRIRGKDELDFCLDSEFEVESYLQYQGKSFIKRFDANSYLYITRAVDYFDYGDGKLSKTLCDHGGRNGSRFLVISFSSDWLYPPYQSVELVAQLKALNLPVTYCEIESKHGHDAFLLEHESISPLIEGFLKQR